MHIITRFYIVNVTTAEKHPRSELHRSSSMAALHSKPNVPLPAHDLFGTPENDSFQSTRPYSALLRDRKEIRLLQILPDDREGTIDCILRQSKPLSEIKGQYTALSYCAGDPQTTKKIFVNGNTCNVFANLEHALHEARYFWKQTHGKEDLLMWVDQICINQMDLGERSHQVGFMRDIYEHSNQVLVCLSTRDGSGLGIRWLRQLIDDVRAFDEESAMNDPSWVYSNPECHEFRFDQYPTDRLEGHSKQFLEGWIAFLDIAESLWWTRAWVFQEFIVAPEAHFLHCRQHITWQLLHSTLPILNYTHKTHMRLGDDVYSGPITLRFKEGDSRPAMEVVNSMIDQKFRWTGTSDLKHLLVSSRRSSASDVRDRIYAMLGLADSGYNIIPNYTHPIPEVLVETTRRIIEHEDSLCVLNCSLNSRRRHNLHLPSWVVDWTQVDAVDELYVRRPDLYGSKKANAVFKTTSTGVLALLVWGVLLGSASTAVPVSVRMGWLNRATTIETLPSYWQWKTSKDPYWSRNGAETHFLRSTDPGKVKMLCAVGVKSMDELWILKGSSTPFILRRLEGSYQFISPVYEWNSQEENRKAEPNMRMESAQNDFNVWQRISII